MKSRFRRKVLEPALVGLTALVVLTGCFSFSVSFSQAAMVVKFMVQGGSDVVSEPSDYEVRFQLGDAWTEGESMSLVFPDGFTASFVTENDVDVLTAGKQATTAQLCDQVDLAVTTIGSAINLERCSGTTALAAGSEIVIIVGRKADSYGSGTHRIINPATPGDYTLSIAGNSGNEGSATISLVANQVDPSTSATLDMYLTTPSGITLTDNGNKVAILSSTPIVVSVAVNVGAEVLGVTVEVNNQTTSLSRNEAGIFSGEIITPSGTSTLSVLATLADGGEVRGNLNLSVVPMGGVYDLMPNGDSSLMPDSVVTIYQKQGDEEVAWDADAYGITNPILTDDGRFGVYVPNGEYILYAVKAGYSEVSVPLTVTNNILTPVINIDPIVVTPIVATESLSKQLADILNTPEAETIALLGLPATLAATASTLTSLIVASSLFPYLQYLFTAPWLLLRGRRKTSGTVYNAITKLPIGLAIVRAYSVPGNKLVRTAVTSPEGQYAMVVTPGRYRLEVTKPGYNFPSVYLEGVNSDGKYHELYIGETLDTGNRNTTIALNIPLDPMFAGDDHAPRLLAFKRLLHTLQRWSVPVGILLSIVVFAINPGIFTGAMVVIQVVVLALVMRLSKARRIRGWGVVSDAQTGKPVSSAVIRLFEPKYNKMIESTLTDNHGRYSFLLGPNEYFVTISKPGYVDTEIRPINYTDKKEPSLFAQDVTLDHLEATAQPA